MFIVEKRHRSEDLVESPCPADDKSLAFAYNYSRPGEPDGMDLFVL